MLKPDMIRVNKVENGYVISGRPEGSAPQSYAYKFSAVAHGVDEVLTIVKRWLTEGVREQGK